MSPCGRHAAQPCPIKRLSPSGKTNDCERKPIDYERKPMDCEEYFLGATIFRIAHVWSMGKGRQVSVVSAHRKAMIRLIPMCRMVIPKTPWHPPIALRCSVVSRCAGWQFRKFRAIRVKKTCVVVGISTQAFGTQVCFFARRDAEKWELCICDAEERMVSRGPSA